MSGEDWPPRAVPSWRIAYASAGPFSVTLDVVSLSAELSGTGVPKPARCVGLAPDEARELASELIIAAEKVDPLNPNAIAELQLLACLPAEHGRELARKALLRLTPLERAEVIATLAAAAQRPEAPPQRPGPLEAIVGEMDAAWSRPSRKHRSVR